ncbi:MAG: hypothetical protein QXL14_04095 [Candidatus Aenigmatarchaeota archaeon]
MIYESCIDLIKRIEEKYSIKRYSLIHFEQDKKTLQFFAIEPEKLVELVEKIEKSGFEHIGEYPGDKSKTKNFIGSLKKFLKKENETVSFIYFNNVLFYKKESPSGILILSNWGWVFVPGVISPFDTIYVDYTDQPKERKEKIKQVCKKYNLKWIGSVTQPVLFRICEPSIESFESFIKDVNSFFEEIGYAEI